MTLRLEVRVNGYRFIFRHSLFRQFLTLTLTLTLTVTLTLALTLSLTLILTLTHCITYLEMSE